MAGIYIHIPFCKQACHYCDFHFSTTLDARGKLVDALAREIELQKNYLEGEKVETIYFGGGTPSLLNEHELEKIFNQLAKTFSIHSDAEITLEANPDDLSAEKLLHLKSTTVNRLSIGVQSFFDKDLKWMNRAHNAAQSLMCVALAQDAGFNNISVDLMYGLPESTDDEWKKNLDTAFALNVQHLSCYCLTVEPRTALATFIKNGKSKNISNEQGAHQFEMLMQKARENGWTHYEISNFCKGEFYSKHNTSYWNEKKYLGIGASAHSFNGTSRQWNVANNRQYIQSIEKGIVPGEKEILTSTQQLNERIMTSLRTMWGLGIANFEFSIANSLRTKSKSFVDDGYMELKNNSLILTDRGKMLADRIILEMIFE